MIFADKSRVSLYICDGRARVRVGESLVYYSDVIMDEMASQITSLMIVYSTAYSGADQRKHRIEAPCHWPLCGEFTGTGEFPAQMASNAENVSI